MQRSILFDIRDEIVAPTNETVAQVFARISAWRDSMDGPQVPSKLGSQLRLFDCCTDSACQLALSCRVATECQCAAHTLLALVLP